MRFLWRGFINYTLPLERLYLPVHLHNPKFLVLRYPYCLGLLFQTNFQTKSVYLPVHLHNPKFLVLRYPLLPTA
jgi:hypothetical protein